jgi:rare lipoprotein A
MNQKLLSGFTAALLISTFGLAPSSFADQSESTDEQVGVRVSESGSATQIASTSRQEGFTPGNPSVNPQTTQPANPSLSSSELTASPEEKVSTPADSPSQVAVTSAPAASPNGAPAPSGNGQPEGQPAEVVKIGEYQSQETSRVDNAVATIQPHQLDGRNAATLYVRNIPVLTFLGDAAPTADATGATPGESAHAEVKVASVQADSGRVAAVQVDPASDPATKPLAPVTVPLPGDVAADSRDPVWRATTTAARLNQLHRDNVSADEIMISWSTEEHQYIIKANDTEIVAVDEGTVLPDTIENAAGDMLQATNRIRRQMGGAAPLSAIDGDPNGFGQVSLGRLNLRVSGYASWYGPGFNGNYSASGEVFNQEALTAAHPSLPFGTQVRVTNMDNGQSVVVRINDRGPFAHDRVIDLSAGAARVIGLISSGVAPVSLEVLGAARTATN